MLGNKRSMVDDLLECRNQISILESMNLDINAMITECKPQDSAFVVAPCLTELKLRPHITSKWVFPWSQLTKLHIGMDNAEAVLSQVQNVEELRFILPYGGLGLPDLNPSFPIRLPHVRLFEVPLNYYHRMFEWFEMPLLEHLCVYDYMKFFLFPEGRKAEIASLINHSSCRIRCLTLQFCRGEVARVIMGTLAASIERLCIKDSVQGTVPPLIRLIADSNNGVHLPNLQELEVICCPGQAGEEFLAAIFYLLKVRGKTSRLALTGHRVVPLKMVTVQLELGNSCSWLTQCHHDLNDESRIKILDKVVETMRSWSFVADISFDQTHSQIRIKPQSGE